MAMPDRKRGFPADRPLSYVKIERIVARLRQIIAPGKAMMEALPGWAMFERLTKYQVQVNDRMIQLDYDVQDFPAGVEALTRYDGGKDRIVIICAESTYERLERDEYRARFSLCHEIGHAVLHAAELLRLSSIPHSHTALFRANLPDYPLYRDTEWQADAFAGALLIPAHALGQLERQARLSPVVIQHQFLVSHQAASIRLGVYRGRRDELLSVYNGAA